LAESERPAKRFILARRLEVRGDMLASRA